MSVSFEDLVWTLVFLFSVRRGCWLLREWSIARSCARGAARRVPVSERRRRRRGLATEVSPRRPSGRSSPVPYRTGRTVRGVALLSCAGVSVRSVVWREAAGVVFARVSGPVSSVAGARAACGARRGGPRVRARSAPAAPPSPAVIRWEDLCFCLSFIVVDRGHEYGELRNFPAAAEYRVVSVARRSGTDRSVRSN